jgi:hypothetical protein
MNEDKLPAVEPEPVPASEELKPCPFCGSKPNILTGGELLPDWHYIGCQNEECKARASVTDDNGKFETATIVWNTRPGEEAMRIHLGKEIAKAEYSNRVHADQIKRLNEEINSYAEVQAETRTHAEHLQKENEQLRSALLVVLDQVDYTAGNCGLTEMVGAVLDRGVIAKARGVLRGGEG